MKSAAKPKVFPVEHEEQLDMFPELFAIYPRALWQRMGMWMVGEIDEDPRCRAECEVAGGQNVQH